MKKQIIKLLKKANEILQMNIEQFQSFQFQHQLAL